VAGSTTLAAGLTTAAGGASALVDGAGQLSAQGTSVLVSNGKETAADDGVKYAVIEAGAQRAADEGMAYGAPSGAAGATAYSIEIAGVDGAGAGNVGRGFASIVLSAVSRSPDAGRRGAGSRGPLPVSSRPAPHTVGAATARPRRPR